MIDLPYSLVIEATEEPDFFGFYSPDLGGFTGAGHSIEDCLYQARWGMEEHVKVLKELNFPVPPRNESPTVTIQNEMKAVNGGTKRKRGGRAAKSGGRGRAVLLPSVRGSAPKRRRSPTA